MTAQHPGPPLAVPAIASALLFVSPALLTPLVGATSGPATPYDPPEAILRYYADNQAATQLTGLLLFWSAIALALFTALAWSRLSYLAPNAPGPAIGAVGGLLAAALLTVSSVGQVVLGHPGITEAPVVVRAIQFFQFLCGGPTHTAALGVLVFGLAITLWFVRRTPRWLSVVGFVIAVVALLSSFAMVLPQAAPLIPLGRFTGLIWLVTIGFLIPRNRARRPLSQPTS